MKCAVIMSSELGLECWSPLRFTGNCHECPKCDGHGGRNKVPCRLPQAKRGRVILTRQKLNRLRLRVKVAENDVKLAEMELEKAMEDVVEVTNEAKEVPDRKGGG